MPIDPTVAALLALLALLGLALGVRSVPHAPARVGRSQKSQNPGPEAACAPYQRCLEHSTP